MKFGRIDRDHYHHNGILVTRKPTNTIVRKHGYDDVTDLIKTLPLGAKVLDVGAGQSSFGRDIADARPDISWTDLDPAYNKRALRRDALRSKPDNLEVVPAGGDDLTTLYGSETFDRVFSYFMLPHLVGNRELAKDIAAQMYEVTKFAGHLSVGPVKGYDLNAQGVTDRVTKNPGLSPEDYAVHLLGRVL